MKRIVLSLGLALFAFAAVAEEIPGTLSNFTSGTTISSSTVNAHFDAVETAVDDNAADIDALQAAPNTNAATICAGTNVYLDGEGNCDTVVDTDTNTNAATICTGTDVYLDGEGNCDTISGGGSSPLTDGGTDIYPTNGEDLCDDASCTDWEITGAGDATFNTVTTADITAEPGNLLSVDDNDTAFTNDPTCANSGTAGQLTIIDRDESASDTWVICDGTSELVDLGSLAGEIASGTSALGTVSIAANSCATTVTTSATGAATTDVIDWTPNADIESVNGYGVGASGDGLVIYSWPTSGNVNFKVCNATGSAIVPGAVTLNWRIDR